MRLCSGPGKTKKVDVERRDDVLSAILSSHQLQARVFANPRFCGDWRFGTSGEHHATFHMVAEGNCWLHTADALPQRLGAGDFVMFPHDAWHLLTARREVDDHSIRMVVEGSGPFTTLICGYFEFLAGGRNPVMEALPQAIVVPCSAVGSRLQRLAGLVIEELAEDAPGTKSVLDKLGDVLFVVAVRHHVNSVGDRRGLLAALADPRLRRALDAMHRTPGKPWTLQALATEAAMSRTVFAERFAEVVGMTPMEYLTRWRMTQAELLLRNPRLSADAVAERVGYDSAEAFRRAFKRVHGRNPSDFKRWLRTRLGLS